MMDGVRVEVYMWIMHFGWAEVVVCFTDESPSKRQKHGELNIFSLSFAEFAHDNVIS